MEKKNKKQLVIVSSTLVGILLVAASALLIVKYCAPKNSDPQGQSYLAYYEPNLITETTSIKNKSLKLDVNLSTNIQSSLTITSSSQAMIAPYQTHSYLFRSYGDMNNTVTMSIVFIDLDKQESITDYSDLEYIVYVGNKDDNSLLPTDQYQVNDGVLTYSSSSDIFIYKVAVGVKI